MNMAYDRSRGEPHPLAAREEDAMDEYPPDHPGWQRLHRAILLAEADLPIELADYDLGAEDEVQR